MKKILISAVLLTILCAASTPLAQEGMPKVAAYITAGNSANEDRHLSTIMLTMLNQQGLFRTIERGDAFLAQVAREHTKQQDGSVDNNQVRRIGRQFGVQYICVGDITAAFGMVQISSRIVDVETAEIIAMGDAEIEAESVAQMRGPDIRRMLTAAVEQMTPGILRALERR
jgi:curli biogenesis system outer membrane secretion channel CsgG